MPVLIIGTYGEEKVKGPILCQVDFFAGKWYIISKCIAIMNI